VLTQGADDERVEFGNDDAREARVLEELAGAGAITAAEDDGSAWRGVFEGGEVGKAFVDHELVGLGGHGVAVEAVELAKGCRVFHRDVLEAAAHLDWWGAGMERERRVGRQG
jgi:hypothetical protein